MTLHETIIAGRGARKRTVRVERRRRAWTDAEIRGAGLTAVGDALFRMGGALSGRDVARILAERKRASDPVGKSDMGGRGSSATASESRPVLSTEGDPLAACHHASSLSPGSQDGFRHGRNSDLGAPPGHGLLDPDRRPIADRGSGSSAVISGALADDVCRHIWADRGRFAPELYGSGM